MGPIAELTLMGIKLEHSARDSRPGWPTGPPSAAMWHCGNKNPASRNVGGLGGAGSARAGENAEALVAVEGESARRGGGAAQEVQPRTRVDPAAARALRRQRTPLSQGVNAQRSIAGP